MKNPKQLDGLKKGSLSFIRTGWFIGLIIGMVVSLALTAMALEMKLNNSGTHDYGPALFLGLILVPSEPALIILAACGVKYIDLPPVYDWIYLFVVNGVSYSVIGAALGWFVAKMKAWN